MAFTYFFRDMHTLEHAARHVIPYSSGRSSVRVWDAGCAMGPEPYSLAIVFAEKMGNFAFRNLRIDATDLDGSNLFGEIIGKGIYMEDEIKRVPEEIRKGYFEPADRPGHFRVVQKIRNRLAFRRHDLLSLQPIGEGYSLILCKNVLLHFQPAERVEVIRMFHRSLAPGGFLAMEQTQKLLPQVAHLFEQVTVDAQLFRKKNRD